MLFGAISESGLNPYSSPSGAYGAFQFTPPGSYGPGSQVGAIGKGPGTPNCSWLMRFSCLAFVIEGINETVEALRSTGGENAGLNAVLG